MTQHLRDDEISSMLAGTARMDWLRHLEDCAQCERRFEAEKRRVQRIRETLVLAGTRTESYWTAQHARIMASLPEAEQKPVWLGWKMAVGAVALVVFALVLLLRPHPLQSPQLLESQADEQLLMEVEQVANSDVPDAMAPADMLAEDMESHASTFEMRAHVQKTAISGRR